MKRVIALAAAATLLLPASAAMAAGKPTAKPTQGSNGNAVSASAWIGPKVSTNPVQVTAGSTVPLKFRLIKSGQELKNKATVSVTLTGVACGAATMTSAASLAPAKISDKAAAKAGALKYAGKSFQMQWKIAKNAQLGCYKFSVTGGDSTLDGAVIQVVAPTNS